jgi:hypothetical protein
LKLHGFGVKTKGIQATGHLLASADSMAWSFQARKRKPLPHCRHQSCSNCFDYAMAWRSNVLRTIQARALDADEAVALYD